MGTLSQVTIDASVPDTATFGETTVPNPNDGSIAMTAATGARYGWISSAALGLSGTVKSARPRSRFSGGRSGGRSA